MSHWRALAAQVVGGRRWIVALDVLQGAQERAKTLLGLGATEVFALCASMGTGPVDPSIPTHCLDVQTKGLMEAIRAGEAALDAPSAEACAALDAFDPDRAAKVYRVFFSRGAPIAGRPTFGARPPAWQALEDKTVVDAVWDAAGVARAPSVVTAPAAMDRALDRGAGVVFSGDIREGFNGAATYVRWVRDDTELAKARDWFTPRCDRVRAMPFLDGLPCSIHALVTDAGIAVFRPCEMLVFRRPGDITFQYASVATFWRPDSDVVDAMRSYARTVAAHLDATYGYRGVFTIDGVLTSQGFLPTELNPRVGAGIRPLFQGLDIPLEILHFAAIEGIPLDWRLEDLEQAALGNPAALARGGVLCHNERPPLDTRFRPTKDGFVEDPDGPIQVMLGPAASAAGYLRILSTELPAGPPVGPLFAQLIRQLDRDWDLGIGPIEAARDVTA